MGVDYDGVGGVGVEITEEMKRKLVVANEGAFDGYMDELLSDLELEYKEGGSGSYTGKENTFYLMVEGDTLEEVYNNSKGFISKLSEMNIDIKLGDIVVIEDLHVW